MANNTRIPYLSLAIGIPLVMVCFMFFSPAAKKPLVLDLELIDENRDNLFGVNERISFKTTINSIAQNNRGTLNFGDTVKIITVDGMTRADSTTYASGHIYFDRPGEYLLLFSVNRQQFISRQIEIIQTDIPMPQDTLVSIHAPGSAQVGNEVIFSAYAEGVNKWYWEFGESGTVDDYDGQVVYTYKAPGRYRVRLRTDISEFPIYHFIEVERKFTILDDSLPPPPIDTTAVACEDIKKHLQSIADASVNDSKVFYKETKYIVKNYLDCNKNKTPVVINGTKYNDFMTYCQGLHYLFGKRGKRLMIEEVKIDALDCIGKLEVAQVYSD